MRRERVPKRVAGHALLKRRVAPCPRNRTLHDCRMQVMATTDARPIDERSARREDVRPRPAEARTGILSLHRRREPGAPHAEPEIAKMQPFTSPEISLERRYRHRCKRRAPVAQNDLATIEVHVLDAQR